ncbi:hypothetical protein HYALB_00007161 [Hymenoscyphus albidus]|uniref:Wax synthase domain-containing protein n=1 Tax=Hymenoscyphus albidus TaxID=595503 RepID=A0A9N9Q2I3_9HELO|nr:hypothetical protein HYALB_00007161 [Hymenoscyphus albidus]
MSIHSAQPNSTLHEPDSSFIPHILLFAIQFVALASPPFRGRRTLFSTAIIILAVHVHIHPHFTNNVALAQPFTIAWSYYMNTLAKLLFSHNPGPEFNYWRMDQPPREALSYTAFSAKKILWAITLVFNQRGIPWNFQIKHVPSASTTKRASFLAKQAFEFLKCFFIADLLFELNTRLFTPPDGRVGWVDSQNLTLRHPDFRWNFVKAFVFGATPYFMLSMQYAQFAFFAVLFRLSKPEDWPPPFGRLADVTTVRHFWGKYWHQQLRSMLISYADALASALQISKGTTLSSYMKLYVAFGISGAFHALSQMKMPCSTNITPVERTFGFFLFFLWQMAAITVEDLVQWAYQKIGFDIYSRDSMAFRTLTGYVWVVASFWVCLPLVGDTFLRMRIGVVSLLPISVMKPFVEMYVPIPP